MQLKESLGYARNYIETFFVQIITNKLFTYLIFELLENGFNLFNQELL